MSVMTPILTTPSEIRYADCPGLAESAACACGSAHAFANAISKAAPSARIIASRRQAQRLVFDDCSLAPFKPRPLCQTIKEWQADDIWRQAAPGSAGQIKSRLFHSFSAC